MRTSPKLGLAVLVLLAAMALGAAARADAVLSGTVKAASGEALSGVTVSAKADGKSITTSVFTDESGAYYFPALPAGTYRLWAQALSFETARGEVDLGSAKHQDFTLKPMQDFARQLPGDVLLASLPDDTPEDARMKRLVRNNCTGCHTPSYVLQHRFDEAGWTKIIDLMKHVNVSGIYQGPDSKPNGILDFHEKELAAYLARARGPGESAMKFKLRPRPSGETARVVIREYDVPIDPELGLDKTVTNDGSDWSQGTPSRSGSIVHDAWADLDGNLWFTSNTPNHTTTVGRVDPRTGEARMLKIAGLNGLAAQAHGMTRDPEGILWFNANPGRGGLARLDPKTEKISVYIPPQTMSPTGGATTVDFDGKGKIWVSSPDGALRFDPDSEKFTEFKSPLYKTPQGTGLTYGLAADRDGNGWWAEMSIDIVNKGDPQSGKSTDIKLQPVAAEVQRATPEAKQFYDSFVVPDFNTPVPWAQGPRRMGTDKNADVLYVGNSWGGNFARIDTHTLKVDYIPLPGFGQQPYQIAVDRNHNAWTNLWSTDQLAKYDPAAGKWTLFDLPGRGTEARYISLLEQNGSMQVVVPCSRTSKIAVMTFRSDADLQAAKAQAGR
ncbi:MAG TPA: carboxypeptidase regulatory-like domain-containing protein [Alphaproteobacteria bacterium]